MQHIPWYEDPVVLVDHWTQFVPTRGMTNPELLNAWVRFMLYGSVLVSLYQNEYMPLVYGVIVIVLVSLIFAPRMHDHAPAPTHAHRTDAYVCTTPTESNPFMNVLPHEYHLDKPPACDPADPDVSAYFERGLVREVSDPYKKRASDRQFMTMPVTSSIPDTYAFRNYVFGSTAEGPKCKIAH